MLELPTYQLGLQQNIPWRWEPGFLGNIQKPWTAVWPKRSSQFLISPMKRRHNSHLAFENFDQDSRLLDRHVPGKFAQNEDAVEILKCSSIIQCCQILSGPYNSTISPR